MKRRNQIRKMLARFVFKPIKNSTSKDVLAAHILTSKQIWAFSDKK